VPPESRSELQTFAFPLHPSLPATTPILDMYSSVPNLLRVLTQPPTPVVRQKTPKWQTGDIIWTRSAPETTHFFILLDVNDEGHTLALRLTDQHPWAKDGDYSFPIGVDMSIRPGTSPVTPVTIARYLDLSKLHFATPLHDVSIAGGNEVPLSRFPLSSMNAVKLALAQKWEADSKTWFSYSLKHGRRVHSETASTTSETTLTPEMETETLTWFDKFLGNAYYVERFLDIAYQTLDETDYEFIQGMFGSSNKFNLIIPTDSQEDSTYYQTWHKLVNCAIQCGLGGNPADILTYLAESVQIFGCQGTTSPLNQTNNIAGVQILHVPIEKPWIMESLPTEIWLSIISMFDQVCDRTDLLHLGQTTKFFNKIVNIYLYRNVPISGQERWNSFVQALPKYGHLVREIYIEDDDFTFTARRFYKNLRAIGDFCPLLQRLYLQWQLRLDMAATAADLPPKLHAVDNVENDELMQIEGDAQEEEYEEYEEDDGEGDDEGTEDGQIVDGPSSGQAAPTAEQLAAAAAAATAAQQQAAQQAQAHAAYQAALNAQSAQRAQFASDSKAATAEIDHIIAKCPALEYFSTQWTGKPALERFYQKIPNLKALRLWDETLTDEVLIAVGKSCRTLERFYFDGQDNYRVTGDGIVGLVSKLQSGEKSRLKKLGVYFAKGFYTGVPPVANGPAAPAQGPAGDDDVDDDDPEDEDDEFDDDDDDEMGGQMLIDGGNQHPAAALITDVRETPLYKFINVLSKNHPNLQRLALIGCATADNIVGVLGQLHNLESLDLSQPTNDDGLSTVGIYDLVSGFRAGKLLSLNLSYHIQLTGEDIALLTGPEGIKSLRYVRFSECPHLKGAYLHDEWVHSDDMVMDSKGSWRPREDVGVSSLWIGDGWKEGWDQ
jgi:hypothetical protein